MVIKAKIENQRDWLFLEEIPDKYIPNHRLSEKQLTIRDAPIGMKNYQISTNGLFLIYSEMKFDTPVNMLTEVEGEAIASQFIFVKDSNGTNRGYNAARSRHNIRFLPSSKDSHPIKPDVEYTYLLIVLSKDYYMNLVDLHSILHENFIQDMEKGLYTSFVNQDLYVTPEMRKSIEEIRACRHDGELKKLFTDARILELLMYQLEQFNLRNTQEDRDVLNDEDLSKLEAARETLEKLYVEPPTHKQLSKIVLLNEFKLRSGFKKYFGTTIYDYVTRLRMQEARRLIVEERKNIYEVSIQIGFKHQGNFTNAFKKYYGITPSDLRF